VSKKQSVKAQLEKALSERPIGFLKKIILIQLPGFLQASFLLQRRLDRGREFLKREKDSIFSAAVRGFAIKGEVGSGNIRLPRL
jgi:hypothetical protein